jgi:hypothetical protein
MNEKYKNLTPAQLDAIATQLTGIKISDGKIKRRGKMWHRSHKSGNKLGKLAKASGKIGFE